MPLPDDEPVDAGVITHENVRGPDYYN